MIFLRDFDRVGSSSGAPLKPLVIHEAGQLCGMFYPDATDMGDGHEDDDEGRRVKV
jgi:hypothetical protein